MSEWKEKKLGDIADIVMGQSPKGETCNTNQNGLPLLNGPTEYGIKYPKPLQYTVDPKRLANKGDILFCVRGSTTGRMNWADQEYAIGRGIAAVRHKIDENVNTFIKGVLEYCLPSLLSGADGSVFPNITGSQLSGIPILLPPLPEQRAIAGVLSSLDDKIDLLHRQNKTLEGMAEALWRKMFVEEADPGCRKGKLGDIAEINPLRSLKKDKIATYLDMSNMPTSGAFPLDWVARVYSGGMKFKNGDTIVARITPCLENGKTAYVNFLNNNEIAWGSTEYIVLSPKNGYRSEWFYFLARHNDFRDFAIQNMTGTSGRQRVSGESIAQYEIAIPAIKNSEQFGKFAGPLMEHIKHNSFQIRTLSRLRDTLLPKLMSEEVRVRL